MKKGFSRLFSIREAFRVSEFSFDSDDLTADLKSSSARGAAVTLGAQSVRLVLTLLSTGVLARILAPSDFGLVAMTTAVIGLAFVFRDLGLSAATIQLHRISHQVASTIFWINLAVAALLALVVIASSPLLVRLYSEERVRGLTLAFGIIILVSGISMQHRALLERRLRFLPVAVADVVAHLVGIGVAIALALAGAGYWALVALPGVHAALNTTIVWRLAGWMPGKPSRSEEVPQMLRFGGELTGFSLINYFGRNLDNALIGWRWGSFQLGLYSRAYQLLLLPLHQVNTPVASVMVPALSRLQDQPERYRLAYTRALEALTVVTLPAIAFMIVTSDWIIVVVLGEQWRAASSIFAWLGGAALFQAVGNSTGWLFISQGRTREMLVWGVAGTTISVASFLIGLPHGPVGVAAAYAIGSVAFHSPLLFWFVGRRGPVTSLDLLDAMSFPLVTAAAVAGSISLFRLVLSTSAAEPPALGGAAVIAGAIYFGMLRTRPGRKRAAHLSEFFKALSRDRDES